MGYISIDAAEFGSNKFVTTFLLSQMNENLTSALTGDGSFTGFPGKGFESYTASLSVAEMFVEGTFPLGAHLVDATTDPLWHYSTILLPRLRGSSFRVIALASVENTGGGDVIDNLRIGYCIGDPTSDTWTQMYTTEQNYTAVGLCSDVIAATARNSWNNDTPLKLSVGADSTSASAVFGLFFGVLVDNPTIHGRRNGDMWDTTGTSGPAIDAALWGIAENGPTALTVTRS